MKDHPQPQQDATSGFSRESPDDLRLIQELLVGEEIRKINHIQARLDDTTRYLDEVTRVLPRAVAMSSASGEQLAQALRSPVEQALRDSVRKNPSVLTDAIFPILGPAIRKSISEALSRLVQSLNRALEYGTSWRGLAWRWEAFRTGRSFAEVSLCHSLIYRVEQVFLIHNSTGILLQHVHAAEVEPLDPDIVSGMLTAIRDFVRDSFSAGSADGLHTLQVGELNLWLEPGPDALLTVVIRGQAPEALRLVLQHAIEEIHREWGDALKSFHGDVSMFLLTRPALERCLLSGWRNQPRAGPSARLIILLVLLVLGAGFWITTWKLDARRWDRVLARLRAEEGIVVTEADRKRGKLYVSGLLDALATDPLRLVQEAGAPTNRFIGRWRSFESLSPELVLRRAVERLQPPPGVRLRLERGTLIAEGVAPGIWLEQARLQGPMIAGIKAFNIQGVTVEGSSTLSEALEAKAELESLVLFFNEKVDLAPGQDGVWESLISRIEHLRRAAQASGREARILVTGHTDRTGWNEYNQRLSLQRAEHVAKVLSSRGIPAWMFRISGAGTNVPFRSSMRESDERLNRRVTFEVWWEEARATP